VLPMGWKFFSQRRPGVSRDFPVYAEIVRGPRGPDVTGVGARDV